MFRSLKLGRLFGVPVYVHPTFFLLPLWLFASAWGEDFATQAFLQLLLAALFGCVVLHEFGHVLAARAFGIRTRDVTLYPIGGVARLEGMGERPSQELVIALAGPAVNVVIAVFLTPLLLLSDAAPLLFDRTLAFPAGVDAVSFQTAFLALLWKLNVGLVLFNMIPAFPMDGGRVLRAALASWLGRLRATEIAAAVGLVAACLLGIVGMVQGTPSLVLVAVFVAVVGQFELSALRQRESRRRAAVTVRVPPAGEPVPPQPGPAAGFSGVLWDGHYRVWVQWRDGRPVAFWA